MNNNPAAVIAFVLSLISLSFSYYALFGGRSTEEPAQEPAAEPTQEPTRDEPDTKHKMKTYLVDTKTSAGVEVGAVNAFEEDGYLWFIDEDGEDVAAFPNCEIVSVGTAPFPNL